MELEEIKKTWSALDDRLKENKSLNERIIREMLERKADKSLKKLLAGDIFAVIVLLVLIPIIIYFFGLRGGQKLFWDITIIFALVLCIVGSIWYIYKLMELFKVDLENAVSKNISSINRYKILTSHEKSIMLYILMPILFTLMIITYIEAKVSITIWMFMTFFAIIAAGITIYSYKVFYKKNINAIQHSLDEIKDLKE